MQFFWNFLQFSRIYSKSQVFNAEFHAEFEFVSLNIEKSMLVAETLKELVKMMKILPEFWNSKKLISQQDFESASCNFTQK